MEPKPSVSIIVAAHNVADTISTTISSCINQTYKNIEILVVNDGSTDNTAAVLERFSDSIRVISQRNAGLAGCRNAGLSLASGSLIAWMDGDDICHPNRIALQVAAMQKLPTVGIVCSDFSAFEKGEHDYELSHIGTYYPLFRRLGGMEAIYSRSGTFAVEDARAATFQVHWGSIYRTMLRGNVVHPPTVMMRRELLDTIGFCDQSFLYSSDYEYLVRASKVTEIAYIAAPLLRYRRSRSQLSRRHGDAGLLQIDTAAIIVKALADDEQLDPATRRELQLFATEAFLSAAQGAARVGEHRRAIRHLISSLGYGFLPKSTLQAVLRILIPNALIRLAKASFPGSREASARCKNSET